MRGVRLVTDRWFIPINVLRPVEDVMPHTCGNLMPHIGAASQLLGRKDTEVLWNWLVSRRDKYPELIHE
jgi:hypothetical protein